MIIRILAQSIAVGLVIGLVVASIATLLDWLENPGGIFHGDQGTNWRFVADTAISWFFPVAAPSGALAALVLFVLRRVKDGPAEAGDAPP